MRLNFFPIAIYYFFQTLFPLGPPHIPKPISLRRVRSRTKSSSIEVVGSSISPSIQTNTTACSCRAIDIHVSINVKKSGCTRDDCSSSNITCTAINCITNDCSNSLSNTRNRNKNSNANAVDFDMIDLCLRDVCLKFAQTGDTLQSLLQAESGSKVHIDLDVLNERAMSALQPKRVLETVGNKQGKLSAPALVVPLIFSFLRAVVPLSCA